MDEKKVVKVIRIEVKNDKFGTKKHLFTDDGQEYKVGTKNKCYSSITANGDYELTMSLFNDKPFVKWAKLLKPADGVAPAPVATQPKPAAGIAMIKTDPDKMAFEKRKQDEIRLEFYSNLAKDVLIHNGEKVISAEMIMTFAEELAKIHCQILDGKSAKVREIEKVFNDEQNTGTEPFGN